MRAWPVLWCSIACGGVEVPDADLARVERAAPDGMRSPDLPLAPESDAVAPVWLEGRLPLAGGASLGMVDRVLALDEGRGPVPLPVGEALGPPSVDATGQRVVHPHRLIGSSQSGLSRLSLQDGAWKASELLRSEGEIDRVALSPDGQRVAFVWAGPQGGVSGLWVVAWDGGEPVRVTNGGAFTPGQPPEGFLPLPVGQPPTWDGDRLRWTSHEGAHSVQVPR